MVEGPISDFKVLVAIGHDGRLAQMNGNSHGNLVLLVATSGIRAVDFHQSLVEFPHISRDPVLPLILDSRELSSMVDALNVSRSVCRKVVLDFVFSSLL